MSGPVFLLASERSGTNLLRRRLSQFQDQLIGPAPLHVLKHLYRAEPFFGDLSVAANFDELLRSALGLAYEHFSPWDEQISLEELRAACLRSGESGRSVIGIMHGLYSVYAERKGYASYFCKDNNLFDFALDIAAALPQARFVYLHRDPRDVVASQLDRPAQSSSVARLAELWRDEQVSCIRAMTEPLLIGPRCYRLSYEEFIADEAAVLERLCQWLDIQPRPTPAGDVFAHERVDASDWKNLTKPTDSTNAGRYRERISAGQIRMIEGIVWHQMRWLGYTPSADVRPQIKRVSIEMNTQWARLRDLVLRPYRDRGLTKLQRSRRRYLQSIRRRWQ